MKLEKIITKEELKKQKYTYICLLAIDLHIYTSSKIGYLLEKIDESSFRIYLEYSPHEKDTKENRK